MLAADHALGREFHQYEPDRRAARMQLLRELPFRWQAPIWPELARCNQFSDGALHALCLGAHTTPRPTATLARQSTTRDPKEAERLHRAGMELGHTHRHRAGAWLCWRCCSLY